MIRTLLDEAASLSAVLLFVGAIGVWAGVFTGVL